MIDKARIIKGLCHANLKSKHSAAVVFICNYKLRVQILIAKIGFIIQEIKDANITYNCYAWQSSTVASNIETLKEKKKTDTVKNVGTIWWPIKRIE